jgi:beta-lactam-binding protein with PASTA domain
MTDGNTSWGTSPTGQSERPSRGVLVAGAVAAALVLATLGAVGGWALADQQLDDAPYDALATTTTPATPPAQPTVTKTGRTPDKPPKTTATTLPAGQFALPNLVGMEFTQARQVLRDHKLGWNLVFGGVGNDRQVSGTDPRAGTSVKQGRTVTITVIGAAPLVAVPVLTGLGCEAAADRLVDSGLYPDYHGDRKGLVTRQDPQPQEQLKWNDKVQLYCGKSEGGPGVTPDR